MSWTRRLRGAGHRKKGRAGISDANSALTNATKGISGAINQGIGAAQRAIGGLGDTVSNAFKASDNLAQQSQAVNEAFGEGGAALSEEGKKLFNI